MHATRSLIIAAALALGAAGTAHGALVGVSLTGLTDNTLVNSGDPCGTGLTGPNGCNSQVITFAFTIDTSAAPADTNASAIVGNYRAITAPGFLSGSVTINGRQFDLPLVSAVDHTVDVYDNLSAGSFGILDRAQFVLSGSGAGVSFTAFPNVVMNSSAFAGDGLDVLGEIVGSPLAFNGSLSLSNGSFNFSGPTGSVQGQYRLSSAAFSAVPLPAGAWFAVTGLVALLARARPRGR